MNIDNLLELVKKRRSIRRFKRDPVPDGYIEHILETARWAMSGANAQPWEFVVVKNSDIRAKIGEMLKERWNRESFVEEFRVPELRHQGVLPESRELNTVGLGDPPAFIVVCGDPRTFQSTVLYATFLQSEHHIFHMNIGNATQIIHLAAAALGLNSQWITVNDPLFEDDLKNLLSIPRELRVFVIVPIGYPAYEPAPSYRRELAEIVHYESYDQSKYRTDEDIRKYIVQLREKTRPTYVRKKFHHDV
ncbi:nitroreductase family protein [Chloroflexota bacterium]